MEKFIKKYKGLDIYFVASPCEISIRELLPDFSDEDIKKNEEHYICFDCEVYAKISDTKLSSDYLGECIYLSHDAFINEKGGYFDEMIETVYTESIENLKELNKEINQILNLSPCNK